MSNSPLETGTPEDRRYHRAARTLHWLMALGFVLMWVTGVIVTNVEGVPYFNENDRQAAIRDLHKSIGLTLLALLIARAGLRFVIPAPALPAQFSEKEKGRAHLGHLALYVTIAAACITGLAIADTQDFGSAYFGIALPKLFPTTESVLGWSVDPWSYAFHAIVSYGLLALVAGHVAFVILHKRKHGIELLPRMLATAKLASALTRLGVATVVAVAVIAFFAVRAFVTLGPEETPRDYMTTTPFSAPEQG